MNGETISVKNGLDLPSRKSISIFILIVILAGAVYFVATSGIVDDAKSATKQKLDDLANEQALKSGMAIEVVSEEELKARELVNTGETNTVYSPGTMPESLKVSNFENLYIVDLEILRDKNEFRFNVRNWGDGMVTLNGVDAIINVELSNNLGVFKEYVVEIIPSGESCTIPAKQKAPLHGSVHDNPELFYSFIESYEIVQINFK
ncbi:MAG: hypothetical protein KAS78_01010 [Candidatus Pacebacteria bacterium]|nr:hypothetical protein [Candidatus Paceibacterota bacterium]